MPEEQRPPAPLSFVRDGDLSVRGRLPWASNATFLVDICLDGHEGIGVYKPRRGERPLWDFPPGLDRREVAAWELSEELGWGLVPPTVLRDGPLGVGSVQWFVDSAFEEHYFTLIENERHHDTLRSICVFDVLANNTDRKSGHCLLGKDGRIWAIDNGLCFHADFKLRTVIWEFAGEPIPEPLATGAATLLDRGVPPALGELLDREEQQALLQRAEMVAESAVFPVDHTGRRYPWPLV